MVANVVPTEELRAFLLRLYAVWEAQYFEALREMFSTAAHVLDMGLAQRELPMGPDDDAGRFPAVNADHARAGRMRGEPTPGTP